MLSNPRITPTDREDMELRQQSLELKKQVFTYHSISLCYFHIDA